MSISATKVKGSKKVTFFPPKPGGLHMRKPTKRWSATTIQTAHWFAIVFTKWAALFKTKFVLEDLNSKLKDVFALCAFNKLSSCFCENNCKPMSCLNRCC
jgi:hypothetical protein